MTVLLIVLLAATILVGAHIIWPHLWQWLIVLAWTASAVYIVYCVTAGIPT
jgi:hypothetical protein